jgi:transcriptional regulator with XRE-family HTH domain
MKQMFRKEFYIDFFYNNILNIDMVNEAIKRLIAENDGGNKKIIAGKLGITPQFLGQLERGERKKPNAALVKRIEEVYGVNVLTGKQIEANVSRETGRSEVVRLVDAFESAVHAFSKALDSNRVQFDRLEDDKTWLKQHIKDLTMSFNTLKQA